MYTNQFIHHKIKNNKQDYIFFSIWSVMWFIIDLYYSPSSLDNIGRAIKLFLLLYVIVLHLHRKKPFQIGFIGVFLLFGLFSAIFNNQLYPFFREIIWGRSKMQNLVLIFIALLYIDNYRKLKNFIHIYLIFIFLTVTVLGLVQYFALSHPIYDFVKHVSANEFRKAMHYFNNGRLVGLIYSGSNNASLFLLILSNFLIILLFFQKRRSKLYILLFILNTSAIFLTYTRAAWIAFFSSFILIMYFNPGKVRVKQFVFAIFLLSVFYYFIDTYLVKENRYEYYRILSNSNITGRFYLYSIFINQIAKIPILGYGLISDASANFSKLSSIFMTAENNFFNLMLYSGIPFILFFMILLAKQIITLSKILKRFGVKNDFFLIGSFLFLSQITTIIINNTTTNKFYITLLFYGLITKYLKFYKQGKLNGKKIL